MDWVSLSMRDNRYKPATFLDHVFYWPRCASHRKGCHVKNPRIRGPTECFRIYLETRSSYHTTCGQLRRGSLPEENCKGVVAIDTKWPSNPCWTFEIIEPPLTCNLVVQNFHLRFLFLVRILLSIFHYCNRVAPVELISFFRSNLISFFKGIWTRVMNLD